MTPKIDYALLGQAVSWYTRRGYEYVEVPWAVEEMFVRGTLPEWAACMAVGQKAASAPLVPLYAGEDCLVGSAEQGFLALDLKPGRYVGVTPCFRIEEKQDLFYQDMFMKVELYSNVQPRDSHLNLMADAKEFMSEHLHANSIRELETGDGHDLLVGGVEVGSYGLREHPDFGEWTYGTGLALPRFSVARALAKVV